MENDRKTILKQYSRDLRKHMTKEERLLWYEFLKKLPVAVYRQKIFFHYIVDFYIAKENVIIELDGIQHGEEKNALLDRERDQLLINNGYQVLRYTNKQVLQNFEGVCKDILNHLKLEEKDLYSKSNKKAK